jgi:hypothetical protein
MDPLLKFRNLSNIGAIFANLAHSNIAEIGCASILAHSNIAS